MKRHLIFCGLQTPHLTIDQADQLVKDLAMAHFPNGHTIYQAEGRWQGVMIECNEPTLVVEVWEVAGFGQPPIGEFCVDYKDLGRQESVVLLTIPCEATVF